MAEELHRKKAEMLSEADYQEYTHNGFKPIDETKIWVDPHYMNKATLERILSTEVRSAYFGHRNTWRNVHRDELYKFKNVAGSIGREMMAYLMHKVGRLPQGEDIPRGCNDEGIIVKPQGPAIITGSGPSLDKVLPLLKNWKGGLFCSANAQSGTVRYYGAHPTHSLMFDSQLTLPEFSEQVLNPRKTIVVTHPGMLPTINAFWKGKTYWYKIFSPNMQDFSEMLRSGFDFLHSTHYPFACATAGLTAFAHAMGYDPLIYVGADFGFSKTADRFTEHVKRMQPNGRRKWVTVHPKKPEGKKDDSILVKAYNGVLTHYLHVFYSVSTMCTYWLDTPNIIDCSDGILTGLFPRGNIEDIIDSQGEVLKGRTQTREQIRDFIEPWLAHKGSFFVPMLDAHKLCHTINPEDTLEPAVRLFKKQDPDIDVDAVMKHSYDMLEKYKGMDYGGNSYRET